MNILAAFFCILLFSLTVPCTRIAALELPTLFLVGLRITGAAFICAVLMARARWVPPKRIWGSLLLTGSCAVAGFTVVMAYAMAEVPGSHGAIGLATLPVVTAAYASVRDRTRAGAQFWFFALAGTSLSFSYFLIQARGGLLTGDLLLILGVLVAAVGYVEGARLSREYGGTRVMSWAILLCLPVGAVLCVATLPAVDFQSTSTKAWLSVLYLAAVSQAAGMFLWYRVLAIGPIQKVAMVQLVQPFLTLIASALLLAEQISTLAWVLATLVVLCIVGANRSKRALTVKPVQTEIAEVKEEQIRKEIKRARAA